MNKSAEGDAYLERQRVGSAIIALAPFLLLIGVLFLWPVIKMLSRSVLEPQPGFSQFLAIANEPLYLQVMWTTLRISILVTLLSIVLAFPVAHYAAGAQPFVRNVIFAVVLVPFWTSLLVRVYGWTFILQRTGVVNESLLQLGLIDRPLKLLYTEGAVVLGITHYMAPFMIISIYVALRAIDPRLISAAATMGAKPFRIFRTITVPLAAPGIVAGSILVFVGSIGFFVTPALMGSPSEMMMANLITFQVKEALNWPRASALATALVFAVAVLGALYFSLTGRTNGKAEPP